MNRNLYCLFGVSGAGKSYFVRNHLAGSEKYEILEAGDILKSETQKLKSELNGEEGSEILNNQTILIQGVERAICSSEKNDLLFVGHSIIDNGKELISIPHAVIQRLMPKKIFFLEVEPKTIFLQRTQDVRVRVQRSIEFLDSLQNQAKLLAKEYAEVIQIPFVVLPHGQSFSIN